MMRSSTRHRSIVVVAVSLLVVVLLVQWNGARPSPAIGRATWSAVDDREAPGASNELAAGASSRAMEPVDVSPSQRVEAGVDPSERPADWPTKLPDGAESVKLRLDVVDALTGRPVDAEWTLQRPIAGILGSQVSYATGLWATTDERRRRATDVASVLVWDGGATIQPEFVATGHASLMRWRDGVPIAAGVRELRLRAPLHRTMTLTLTVLGPDDRPASGARVSTVATGGQFVDGAGSGVSEPSDARGALEVPDVPFLPGEPVLAYVHWKGDEVPDGGRGAPLFPLALRVPSDFSRSWTELVRLPGTVTFRWDNAGLYGGVSRLEPFEVESPRLVGAAADDATHATGAIRVRVVRCDGRPGAFASLECGGVGQVLANASGEAVISGCAVGEHDVRLGNSGWRCFVRYFSARARVRVIAGETTDLVLHEPVGARLNVSCVDVRGLPLPSACVGIATRHGDPVSDVTDGVQRLDPFTDENGWRTFTRVPPDTIRVRATWGSRVGQTTLEVVDGENRDVHLVLK